VQESTAYSRQEEQREAVSRRTEATQRSNEEEEEEDKLILLSLLHTTIKELSQLVPTASPLRIEAIAIELEEAPVRNTKAGVDL
jgi:hypothetical protein